MACPSSMTRPSRSRATVQRQPAWVFEPQGPLHARVEPRDRPRSSMMFATAARAGIEPHRSVLPQVVSWAQPRCSAAGEWKEVDTSRFVLIVDDDPDLLDVTSFV